MELLTGAVVVLGTPVSEATVKLAKAGPCPRLMVTMPGSAFVQQLGVRRARIRPRRLSVRALDALLDERIKAVGSPALLGIGVAVMTPRELVERPADVG